MEERHSSLPYVLKLQIERMSGRSPTKDIGAVSNPGDGTGLGEGNRDDMKWRNRDGFKGKAGEIS